MLALPLLVLGIALADDPHHPSAANHLAVLANRFDARTHLHGRLRSEPEIFDYRNVNIEAG
jgi:hypothetical protein